MLAIDLKAPAGKAALARLIATADVLLHNMRVDAAERLGLGFEAVAAINPAIIHCAAIGFGQRARYRDRPAFDDIIQAASGIAGLGSAAVRRSEEHTSELQSLMRNSSPVFCF